MGKQSDETVYFRYVGRTTRTRGAIKRHREDLLTRRTGWPLGGIVFRGIPEKWPSRKDNIWTHLQEWVLIVQNNESVSHCLPKARFLARRKYHNHPGIAVVQAWAQDLSFTRKTPQIIKNIEFLCQILSKRKIQERDRERVKQEGRDVKIAGTELEIRHLWKNVKSRAIVESSTQE
ncbi:hypothetical protein BDV39DRAFT_21717 [Aspergillus sergii]|uniref:Uncharacterized protein n=1 Tax=Aspergillus sergii TaxID=1034303 RepID=A0A5N6XBY6_9EURO|nr:hypothetical protein BDV39DRAFT_21717 [Aspergillus sergii]